MSQKKARERRRQQLAAQPLVDKIRHVVEYSKLQTDYKELQKQLEQAEANANAIRGAMQYLRRLLDEAECQPILGEIIKSETQADSAGPAKDAGQS